MTKKNLLIFSMALGIMANVSVALAAANPFSDMPAGHWAYNSVTKLAAEGITNGYGDGTYRGDRNITRYEAVSLLAKLLQNKFGENADANLPFSDVPKNHWAYESVKYTFGKGINKGYDDNTFRGDRYITRYEMAQMIANVLNLNLFVDKKKVSPFSDVPENHWARNAVIMLASKGITDGYGDGSFRGDRNITRYEVAQLLAKVIVSMNDT